MSLRSFLASNSSLRDYKLLQNSPPPYNKGMSTLQEFLIKSAGMEKEAKGAFRKLLERGVTSLRYPRSDYSKTHALMKHVDLSVPLRKRFEQATGRSLNEGSRLDRKLGFYDMLGRAVDNRYDLNRAYNNYLRGYIQRNPQLNRLNRLMRNALDSYTPFSPANKMQLDLHNILSGSILSPMPLVNSAAAAKVDIPTLSTYIVKSPFATTHHIADAKLSEAANKLAADSFRKNPDVVYINNPNPAAGWKQWRSDDIAVNVPGRPWTEDQLAEMITSSNLSGTPLYEAVFNPLSKDAPRIQKVYVPDTPTVRKSLNISDDIKPVTIDEIQSPTQGTLYKGRPGHAAYTSAAYYTKHPLNFDRLHKHVYGKAQRDPLLKMLREKKAWILQNAYVDEKSPLWFAPAARTSWGYMGKPDKLIPVTTTQLRKLRSMSEDNIKSMFDKAQATLDTATIEDLKAAAQAADSERVLGNRANRINSTAPALSEKLNIPIKTVENLLMFNGL